MTIQVDFWQLVLLLVAFFGCVGGFGKVLLGLVSKSLDEKFKAQEEARQAGALALRETIERYTAQGEATAKQLQKLERDFLEWKAEIPIQYVRREDYIRGQAVIEAKLDALYSELKLVQLKGVRND